MKRNTLIAQITLGALVCLAAAQMSQAMEEPEVILVSSDDRTFFLSPEVAFVSDVIRTLKTGEFREAREEEQERPIELDIPGDELKIIVLIMRLLHKHQDDAEAQAAAVAQVTKITPQNIGELIHQAQLLRLPESCITALIDRLARFVKKGKITEIPFDERNLLLELALTSFLKYGEDLELTDAEGNLIDIGSFSIRKLLDAERKPSVQWRECGKQYVCDLKNMRINSLEGLLDIPEINKCQNLELENNQISSIQPGAFRGLQNLGVLGLEGNRITSIQPSSFQELQNLGLLNLARNKISSIQPDSFRGLRNLRYLHLSYNQLSFIQDGAFQGLQKLRTLELQHNKLISIQPAAFQGLPNLTHLYLNYNQITSIQPGMFQGLSNLQWLGLYNNQITSIQPGSFQGLSNLKQLFLMNNQINSIQPDTFQGLLNLGELDLSKNQIHSVTSRTLHGLLELKELNLASNEISSVEPGTFAGPPLEMLNLSDNRLSSDTIQELREELSPDCELKADNQREETPEERRERLAAAAERRMRQKR